MQERFYQLAGLRFRVLAESFGEEQEILQEFSAPEGPWDVDCHLSVVETLSEPEGELIFRDPANRVFRNGDRMVRYKGSVDLTMDGAYIRICRTGNRAEVQIKREAIPFGIAGKVIISCLETVHHLTAAGGFLLHSSWIRVGEKAVLFMYSDDPQAVMPDWIRPIREVTGDPAYKNRQLARVQAL